LFAFHGKLRRSVFSGERVKGNGNAYIQLLKHAAKNINVVNFCSGETFALYAIDLPLSNPTAPKRDACENRGRDATSAKSALNIVPREMYMEDISRGNVRALCARLDGRSATARFIFH